MELEAGNGDERESPSGRAATRDRLDAWVGDVTSGSRTNEGLEPEAGEIDGGRAGATTESDATGEIGSRADTGPESTPRQARLRAENRRLRAELVAAERQRADVVTRYERLLAEARGPDGARRTAERPEQGSAGDTGTGGDRSDGRGGRLRALVRSLLPDD